MVESPLPSDLRIRLEGQLEPVEAAIAQWHLATRVLGSQNWQDIESWSRPGLLEQTRAALERSPEGVQFLNQLQAAEQRAQSNSARLLLKIGLRRADLHTDALAQLQSHLPLELAVSKMWPSPSGAWASWWARRGAELWFAPVVFTGTWFAFSGSSAFGVPCIAVGAIGLVAFLHRFLNLTLTRQGMIVHRRFTPWSEIESVVIRRWKTRSLFGTETSAKSSNLEFFKRDGSIVKVQYAGRIEPVLASLKERNIQVKQREAILERGG